MPTIPEATQEGLEESHHDLNKQLKYLSNNIDNYENSVMYNN